MKVLLIGGTGNISTDCAALLHERGHAITVVTRGNVPVPECYRSVKADRRDRTALAGIAMDVVINFLGYDLPDVESDYAAFVGRIRQYIFISSTTVCAKPHRHLPLTETSPTGNQFSEYAQKKLALEQWLAARLDFPVTVVRPSHTYGCRWFPNVVSSAGWTFPARLVAGQPVYLPNDGSNLWTVTHTTDFAVGLAGLIGNTAAIGETFQITSDEALPWQQIYAETAAALGAPGPVIEWIPVDFLCEHFPQFIGNLRGDKAEPGVFDNAKIKQFVPDFVCRKSFAAGIRESVAWYAAHPAEKIVVPKTNAQFEQVIAAWRENGRRSTTAARWSHRALPGDGRAGCPEPAAPVD